VTLPRDIEYYTLLLIEHGGAVTLSSRGCSMRGAGGCSVDGACAVVPSPEWLVGIGGSFTKVLWNAANFHASPQSVATPLQSASCVPAIGPTGTFSLADT
jgi:hypothetical protein